MTSALSANIILAVPFVVAIIGIPLWMIWKRTDATANLSGSRRYPGSLAHPRWARPRSITASRRLATSSESILLAWKLLWARASTCRASRPVSRVPSR
jgi:hypothetical protein